MVKEMQVQGGMRVTLTKYLVTKEGMEKCKHDPCLFINSKTKMKFIMHVDDGICKGTLRVSQEF